MTLAKRTVQKILCAKSKCNNMSSKQVFFHIATLPKLNYIYVDKLKQRVFIVQFTERDL